MNEIFFGPTAIEKSISNLLKPVFLGNKKEFKIINNLAKNWPNIIGKNYAKFCYPKTVAFSKNITGQKSGPNLQNKAKLTIAVTNSAVAFFLESNSEFIIERIAELYGYKAITKIIIKQEPSNKHFEQNNSKPKTNNLTPKNQERLDKAVKLVKDQELAEIIARLGKDIL